MESKMVTRKREDAAKLRRAAKLFIKEVAPEVAERLSPFLAQGERLPDLAALAELTVRRVDWRPRPKFRHPIQAAAILDAAVERVQECRQGGKLDLIRLELLWFLQESPMAGDELVDLLQLYLELIAQVRPHGEGGLPSS